MSSIRTVSMRALRGALMSSLCFSSAALANDTQGQLAATSSETAHWGYAQTLGPEHWDEVPGAAMCSTGVQQSPVALSTSGSAHTNVPAPSFHYGTSRVRMVNNGHTVVFNYDAGSTITVGSNEYKLAQFHFHTPSEHTKDGVSYPLEVHLVHTDAAGTPKAVVGVLIEEGFLNAALFTAFRNLPRHEGEESNPAGALINASALLPFNRAFFQYAGSLTTPPLQRGAPVVRDEEPHPDVRRADRRVRADSAHQPEQPPGAAAARPHGRHPVRPLSLADAAPRPPH